MSILGDADDVGCFLGVRTNGDSSQGVRASTSDLQGELLRPEEVRAHGPVRLSTTSQI